MSERTRTGFRVKAAAENVPGTFSWRVVAKRADIAGPRLETVSVPQEPVLPNIAPVSAPPTAMPTLPRGIVST